MQPAGAGSAGTGEPPASACRLPWRVTAMRRLARQLPPARYRVAWEPGLRVPAADGSALITDHYLPVTGEACPTVLLRSPYGRGFPWDALYGVALAEQGFHVVIQSCRGTGGSAGTFSWCHHEGADGQAAVAWLRRQDWFNGSLGMAASYLGYTQWALAVQAPPELKATVVQVGMHRPYDAFYPGGVLALDSALIGGVGTAYWQRGMLRMAAASARLQVRHRRITRTLPLRRAFRTPSATGSRTCRRGSATPSPTTPYWRDIDLGPSLGKATAPTALVGGWYDILLDQTLAQYRALRASGRDVSLLIGPWTHTSMMNEGGTVVFGAALGWLRGHLCGTPAGPARHRCASMSAAPASGGTCRTGRRPRQAGPGTFTAAGASSPGPPGESPPTLLRYDPAHPTPSVGGQVLSRKAGPQEDKTLEARPDVLTFTSEPLAAPLEILGTARAELHLGVSDRHAHVFARLCDVDPEGHSRNICDGIRRLPLAFPGEGSAEVVMSPTAYRLPAGHRLRLQAQRGCLSPLRPQHRDR